MANAYKYTGNAEQLIEKLYQKGLLNTGGTGFLQNLIDESIVLKANSKFWQEHFDIEGNEYDIDLGDLSKNPAWTVRMKQNRPVPTADAMAPFSEVAQLDGEGFTEKTGSIYQFGKGLYETSQSKLELQARLRELSGTDQNLLTGYVRGIADLINTHNYTLSNLAAQTLSKGGAYNNTGIKGFSAISVNQSAYVPTANFKTAGAKVWTASDCDIPSQMQKIEYDFKVANNIDQDTPFVWCLPYDMIVNVLLQNAAFLKEVNRYIRLYAPDKVVIVQSGSANVDTSVISLEQLVEYSRSSISKISPIMVVREEQKVQNITTISTVSGWQSGVAVLRPLGSNGKAGVIVHAKVADVEMIKTGEYNNLISVNSAKALGFLYVMNMVSPQGVLKKYLTKVIGRYAPVLNEAMQHVVVDTTTADS
jgi:hypothetical protein